jgi:tetratricopeptide (TPR) repeat protein
LLRQILVHSAAFLIASAPAFAGQHWISISTPHFEMYTTNGEKQAARALQVFEQVRYFFLQKSKNKPPPQGRVCIIAFASEKEYQPYRVNQGAFAYYLPSRERDYIVMQDIQAEHHQAAVHEYTHLIVQHLKLNLPAWLDEGMADLYSSLEPRGQQSMVGRPLEGHVFTLLRQPWMDWNVLFAVDHNSPFYNEKDKMSIFYAQSWVLTHMLYLSPAYGHKFSNFLAAVARGMSTPDALQSIYGKTVSEVGKDAANYVRQSSVHAALFNITLSKSDLDAQVSDLSDFQIGLALANLLATRVQTAPEAQRRLLALERQYSQNSNVEESLGYLAWQQNNLPEACRHFALAVEHGSKNARMIYDYAGLERSNGAPPQKVISLLQNVIALEPDNVDAEILLADQEIGRQQYGAALSVLSRVHSVKPEQAYNFFAISAFCQANLHDPDTARNFAQKALQYAKTPSERQQIDNLLSFLDQAKQASAVAASPQPGNRTDTNQAERVESVATAEQRVPASLARDEGLPRMLGKTKAFECGHGTFRLHIQTANREVVFAMNDVQDIVVRNVKELKWSCGALPSRDVTVVYQPSSHENIEGTVAELIF